MFCFLVSYKTHQYAMWVKCDIFECWTWWNIPLLLCLETLISLTVRETFMNAL